MTPEAAPTKNKFQAGSPRQRDNQPALPPGGRSSGRPGRLRLVGRVKLVGPCFTPVNFAVPILQPPAQRLIAGPSTLAGAVLAGPGCLGAAHGSCGCAASGNPASGGLKQQRSGFLPGAASLRKFLCFSSFQALPCRYSLQPYLYLGEMGRQPANLGRRRALSACHRAVQFRRGLALPVGGQPGLGAWSIFTTSSRCKLRSTQRQQSGRWPRRIKKR